jgi:hypothetical protein
MILTGGYLPIKNSVFLYPRSYNGTVKPILQKHPNYHVPTIRRDLIIQNNKTSYTIAHIYYPIIFYSDRFIIYISFAHYN